MRKNPTDAEKAMWSLLKEHFADARFRRQVPLRHFIADFASHSARLVVEIDGGQHSVEKDNARDEVIQQEGYHILRFWNNDVLDNPEGCARRLAEALASRHPHPAPASEQARKPAHPSPIKGEEGFIAVLRALATHPAARGLADDCAVLEIGSETLVLTHDMMVEGTHYLAGSDMADVAFKLVAVNLSDLAAKGAEPVGVLLGHMLGEDDARFAEGLAEVLAAYDVPLLGGDTVSGKGPKSHGITAIGRATHTPVPSRSGAQVGDALYVTSTLGAAMLGFEALRDGTGGDHTAYSRPIPLIAEGKAIAPHVTAMMDVSDGLLLDAFRMAEASAVSIAIDSAAVPVSDPERRLDCMRWGDDYQLLFTLPAGVESPVPATRIGSVEPRGFAPLFLDGEPLLNPEGLGYTHK